jgi:hypothetical protein
MPPARRDSYDRLERFHKRGNVMGTQRRDESNRKPPGQQQGERGRPSTMSDDKVLEGDLDAGTVGTSESGKGGKEHRQSERPRKS